MKEIDKLIQKTEIMIKNHKKDLKNHIKELKKGGYSNGDILECTFNDEMKIVSSEAYLQGLNDAKKLLSKK